MVLEPKLRVEQSPVRMWSEVRSGGSQYRAGFLRIPINLGSPLDRARKRWMQEVHVEQAQRASFKKQHFSQDPKDWIQAWKARVGESENGNQACGSCDRKGPRVSGKQKGSESVSQGWLIQVALTWVLGTTKMPLLTMLKAGSRKSTHRQGHAPCDSGRSTPSLLLASRAAFHPQLRCCAAALGPSSLLSSRGVLPLGLCLHVTCLPSHKNISHIPRAPHGRPHPFFFFF